MEARIEDRIIKAIVEASAKNISELKPETELGPDLGMDSLDRTELAIELEDRLLISSIPHQTSHGWRTVHDVIESVRNRIENDQLP